jgi:hypothetical protein
MKEREDQVPDMGAAEAARRRALEIYAEVLVERTRQRAHEIYEQRAVLGLPGDALDDWLRAEEELRSGDAQ